MDKKIICFLLLIIIICSSILIYKINKTPEYDEKVYNEVYQEYENIINPTNTSNISQSTNGSSKSETIYIYKNSTGNTYRTIAVINIPKINISYPVINDYSEANLKIAPTKFAGPEPNQVGNFVIVGHNNWNKEFFSNLDKLENDDIIELTDLSGNKISYKVYDKYQIKQNDFSCLNQKTNGKIELTLITCVKHQKNKRLIVKCIAN